MEVNMYKLVVYVAMRTNNLKEAEAGAKNIYAGIWDLIPEQREPDVAAVLFDETGPIHRIERDQKLRGPNDKT
jgi:hypothetical protein